MVKQLFANNNNNKAIIDRMVYDFPTILFGIEKKHKRNTTMQKAGKDYKILL